MSNAKCILLHYRLITIDNGVFIVSRRRSIKKWKGGHTRARRRLK
jgi:hypothetical protein